MYEKLLPSQFFCTLKSMDVLKFPHRNLILGIVELSLYIYVTALIKLFLQVTHQVSVLGPTCWAPVHVSFCWSE